MRASEGPALIHAVVTRPYSHSAADTQSKYRSVAELADETAHDPITLLEAALVEGGVLSDEEAKELREEAFQLVADAAKEAMAAPRPDPATISMHVKDLPSLTEREYDPAIEGGAPVAFGEAIRLTLHEMMAADERIRVFGEDVGDARETVLQDVEGKGGVFGTTHGLQREFGRARCFNTPLAEANIVGRAVGQAIRGLRPAPEVQFFDYIWPAMQQIKTEAATARWRSNGAFSVPMVLRVPIGGYLTGGAIWHSQCGESIFAHVPGLTIAFPSWARDAAGMLRAAFKADDPIMFLEHKHLLRQPYTVDPFPPADYVVPFGRGDHRPRGRPSDRGDLRRDRRADAQGDRRRRRRRRRRTDRPALVDPVGPRPSRGSVAKTGRCLVVHEDVITCGFGAEVAAWIGEHCFESLDAPVRRIAAIDTHVAYEPTLEAAVLPQVPQITKAIEALLDY